MLGHYFNHPIQRLNLPGTLRRLAFGGIFDQPLDKVKWPEKLESVDLGQAFSRDVAGVKWPGGVKRCVSPGYPCRAIDLHSSTRLASHVVLVAR